MSKEIERGTETETTVDSEGRSVQVTRSYERVREVVAKEMQPILKTAARAMRAFSKEGGETGKMAGEACEACLEALSAADCAIVGDVSFERSRMKRFLNQSTGMSHRFNQMERQYGKEEALKRLFEQEISKNTGAAMRYMHSSHNASDNRRYGGRVWVYLTNMRQDIEAMLAQVEGWLLTEQEASVEGRGDRENLISLKVISETLSQCSNKLKRYERLF